MAEASIANPAKPLTLRPKPVLEPGITTLKAVQEVAAVQRRCAFKGVDSPLLQQRLESDDVDRGNARIELDRMAGRDQQIGSQGFERTAKPQQSLLQTVAGLPVATSTPQQGGKLLASDGNAGGNGQKSQ